MRCVSLRHCRRSPVEPILAGVALGQGEAVGEGGGRGGLGPVDPQPPVGKR